MKPNKGMFSIKLNELQQQHADIQRLLETCEQDERPEISRKLHTAEDEYIQNEALLQKSAEGSRCAEAAELAKAQLRYFKTAEKILKRQFPDNQQIEKASSIENRIEMSALYAEYAIDFAMQSMRYALLSALKAIDMQISSEERA